MRLHARAEDAVALRGMGGTRQWAQISKHRRQNRQEQQPQL